MKRAISMNTDANKAICRNSTEEKNNRYKSMKNEAKKAVSEAMNGKAEEVLT